MDYGSYGGLMIERLLKIMDKMSQLRKMTKRTIRKVQAELEKKFEGKSQRNFQKGELVRYYNKLIVMRHDIKF